MITTDAVGEVRSILERLLPADRGPYNLHEPELTAVETARVTEALDEGFVSYAGRHVALFEEALARTCMVGQAVAVVSGTAALQVLLHVLGIGREDEVICPSLTFVATANAIIHAGAAPHFVDSDEAHMGIDAARLDRHLQRVATRVQGQLVNRHTGRRIAAIMPVHVFGHIGDLAGLQKVAQTWGLPIIEDATEALGSSDASGPAGKGGVAAALSFNGNKIVTTGGGGAIVTDDEALACRLKHVTTTAKRPHAWRFDHDEIGFNYRLPNLNAALGVAQLERLADFVQRKRRLADAYEAAFSDARHWAPVREPAGCRSNYWLNVAMLHRPDAALLEEALAALHGVGYRCRPCWTPLHRLAIHADHPRDDLPVAEALAARILCLPSSPGLTVHLR